MKKILILGSIISGLAYGSSIDHIQTYTPDYLANQAQTGLIGNASVYYNPAGLTQIKDGNYVYTGVQYAFGHESMSYNGKEHKANLRQAIPNIALYSVDNNGANFLTFGGIAGGGKLSYKGVSGLDVAIEEYNAYLKGKRIPLNIKDNNTAVTGTNKYEQLTLGRAFKVDDKLSFSIAGRLIHGSRNLKGNLNLETSHPRFKFLKGDINSKREAWGYGLQLGVNYKVNEKLNLAARYDSRIKMNFKAKGEENKLPTSNLISKDVGFTTFYPQYTPNTKTRRDLPAILSLGASYKVTDKWLFSTSGNFYFNRQAKMDRVNGKGTDYKNGWEIALGSEYKLNNKLTLITSMNHAKTGAKSSSYNDVEFALNVTSLGTGIRYSYDDTLDIGISAIHFFYNTSEGTFKEHHPAVAKENQKYKKSINAVGISISKKF